MNNVLQYLFLFVWLLSCALTFYACYKVTRKILRALLMHFFPAKTVTLTVHEENGDISVKEFQTDDYKSLVDNILLEANRRKTFSNQTKTVGGAQP
jgi:hypothetical protein